MKRKSARFGQYGRREIRNSLRELAKVESSAEILKNLSLQKRKLGRTMSVSVFIVFILSGLMYSTSDVLNVVLPYGLKISLDREVLAIILSGSVLSSVVSIHSFLVVDSAVRIFVKDKFPLATSDGVSVVYYGESSWSIGSTFFSGFNNPSMVSWVYNIMSVAVLIIPILAVLFLGLFVSLREIFSMVDSHPMGPIELLAILIASCFAIGSILVFSRLFIRFRIQKNLGYVRWLFLYKMWRKHDMHPKRADIWVGEEKN